MKFWNIEMISWTNWA